MPILLLRVPSNIWLNRHIRFEKSKLYHIFFLKTRLSVKNLITNGDMAFSRWDLGSSKNRWCQFFLYVTRRLWKEGIHWKTTSSAQTKEHAVMCMRESTWPAAWLDANNPSPWWRSSGFVPTLHSWPEWLEGTVWESRPHNRQQLRSSPCFPVTSSLFPLNVGSEKTWRCALQRGFLLEM